VPAAAENHARHELNATVEAAHARGIKVTNGGFTWRPLSLLVWQDYKDAGLDAQADDFAARVFAAEPGCWPADDRHRRAPPATRDLV
jgi:hypothetical protein